MLLSKSGINVVLLFLFAASAFGMPNDIVLQDFATVESEIDWFGPYTVDGQYWVAEIRPENYSLVVGDGVLGDEATMEKVFLVHELSGLARKEIKFLSIFSSLVSKTCWLISKLFAFVHRIFIPWTFGFLKLLVLRISGAFFPTDVIQLDSHLLELVEFLAINQFDIFEGTFGVFAMSAEAEVALADLYENKDYESASRFLSISDQIIGSSFEVLKQEQEQNVYQANEMATIFADGSRLLYGYGFPGAERMANLDEQRIISAVETSNQFIMRSLDKIAEKSQSLIRIAPSQAKASTIRARGVLDGRA